MTILEEDEARLYDKNIVLISQSLPSNRKAMCATFDDTHFPNVIFYDNSKFPNNMHKRCSILHEEMHLEHPETTYYIDECIDSKKRKEKKVDRLIIRKYVPMQKLFELLYVKHMVKYEIAEELCLTEELIQDAYDYYSTLESWNKKTAEYKGNFEY